MRRSALFLHSTLDAMGSHIAILDETGCIVAVNKAWRAFAESNGVDPCRVCEGANYLETCDRAIGDDSEQARLAAKGIRAVLYGEQEFYGTEYPCHSPNEKRWFSMHVTRFTEDRLPRVVVAHETITERKHAEDMLRQRETELAHLSRVHVVGEMAAVLAHELNQPLYAINNYVGGIECRLRQLDTLPGFEELVTAAKCVSDEVNRATGIIRRLHEFVRGREAHRSSVDILQSIRHVTELMDSLARGKGVSLTTRTSKDIPNIQADPIQIEQVIVNLVANAIDAVSELPERRRQVTINAHLSKAGAVEVVVHDSGHGVPLELRDKLFEAFVSTKKDGLGMGLSISRSIILAHGGKIWMVHHEPHGTSFHFTVPLAHTEEESHHVN